MRVIAGSAGGVRLRTPEGMQTRPTITWFFGDAFGFTKRT